MSTFITVSQVIIAVILLTIVVYFLFQTKKDKKFTQEYKLPINTKIEDKKPILKKIKHRDDGCPICGQGLIYSPSNTDLRPNAFFSRYYCVDCEKDTAIVIRIDHGK